MKTNTTSVPVRRDAVATSVDEWEAIFQRDIDRLIEHHFVNSSEPAMSRSRHLRALLDIRDHLGK